MTSPVGDRGQALAAPRASLDRVLGAIQRLGLPTRNQRPNGLMAGCPMHDEKTPSMHVTWQSGQRGGYVLLHCFGCQGRAEDLVEALGLGLADLFDEPLPERDRSFGRVGKSPQRRKAAQRRGRLGRLPALIARHAPVESPAPVHTWVETERYSYVDLGGSLVQEVIREECTAEGSRHKQFRQVFITPDGRRLKRKPPGFHPVLYRAPLVRDAVRDGIPVWVLEGEKDVRTAEQLGLVATTNTQGGKSFPDELIGCLEGATVIVVLDRDATGWARGVDLHHKLLTVAATVRLKLPMVVAPKADFTDHFLSGGGIADLLDVSVEEVAAWDALSAVQAKHHLVDQAIAEAHAHLELAETDENADTHRRYAKRWAVESQIRHEALRDLVDQVHGQGMRVGTVWAGEAMEAADDLLATATDAARRCHDAAGVAVPPSLRPRLTAAPATSEADADAGGQHHTDRDGSSRSRPAPSPTRRANGAGATAPVFRELDGQIVQWEPSRGKRRSQDWDEEEDDGQLKVILTTVVKVTVREFLEVEDNLDVEQVELLGRSSSGRKVVSAPRQLVAVRLHYPDPVTGEQMEIRVMADQWRDHTWVESLPGPVDYDHKRAGLDTLQRAVLAISDEIVDEVLYRATGWRTDPDGGHRFIHRRGAITAEGHQDVEVAFSGPIERYDLPDPTRDPGRLRQAFYDHSATMLDRLPPRVAAPLLGQVYRSVLGHNPWVLTLVGPPGSYKTSIAAKAMQHFGERWDHKKPASSMSGNGDTFNALRYKLHNAKDCLYWMDDFAPTKSWLEAQKHLEETARLIHNQEERSRSSRDGLSVSDGTGPRASGLCTSEVMPRPGSGSERMLVVPLSQEDVQTSLLFPLDEQESRHGRALVLASFIQWLAGDLTALRERYMRIADEYADRLTGQGETVRQSAALAHTWIGWVAMTDALLAAGAISGPERQALLVRVDEALREAGRAAVDDDMPRTTGARVRELLGYALRQGIAYVDDVRTGDCPPWPIAGRLGWRRQVTDVDQSGEAVRFRLERQGLRLGFVMHDPGPRDRGRVLMCDSTQLEAALKSASATQAEQLQIDRNTAMRALYEDGLLLPDESEGKTRFTTKCRIHCENRTGRMVSLQLDRIIGEDLDDDGTDMPDGPDRDNGGGAAPPTKPPPAPSGGPDLAPPGSAPPGLHQADPHPVDGSQQVDVTSRTNQEEGPMRAPEFVARSYTDRDDVVGWSEPTDPLAHGPCVVCSVRCGFIIDGLLIHTLCWERSTAATRATGQTETTGAAASSSVVPAPAQHVVTPQTVPEPARPTAAATTTSTATATSAGAAPSDRPGAAGRFAAAAAVVDTDGIWCSDGRHLPLPGTPTHIGDLVRLAQWLNLGTQVTKYLPARGQIWVADGLARQLGIDVDAIRQAPAGDRDKVARELTAATAAVSDAVGAGYSFGGRGGAGLGRWTRVWKDSDTSVWIVLMAAMTTDGADVPLMNGDPDHPTLARRIGLLADALRQPYQLSGSSTGLDLMTALRWKDRERFFAVREPVPPAMMNVEADISWTRKPTADELAHEFVHAYDRSGSYLAGVSGLELGVGEPIHHPDGAAFTPRIPGYWRIEIPECGDWRMPHPLDPRGTLAGKVRWVTTPGLEFAREQGYEPTILEAYTWPEHARILDPWYERIRDARQQLDTDDPDSQLARDQLKAIYAPTIGMLGSHVHMAGRSGYAPERRHHIVAKARINILRRVAKIGADTERWPVAVIADTVLYTSDDPDPVAAWPGGDAWLGRALGRYKAEGTGRLADQLRFLDGGPYKGKDVLVGRVPGSE